MTYLKGFIGTKSLDIKQCPAGLSPRTVPHYPPKQTVMRKPGDGEEPHPTAKHLLTFATKTKLINKFTSSGVLMIFISLPLLLYHFCINFRLYVHMCYANFDKLMFTEYYL